MGIRDLTDGLQAIAAPIVIAVTGGVAVWYVQARVQELRNLEASLRDERRLTYDKILDPYIRVFASINSGGGNEEIIKQIQSYEYRRAAFELNMVGSDAVVQAYNDLMQYAFKTKPGENQDAREMLKLWASLVLAIRRNLTNNKTKLGEHDMIRSMITDTDEFKW